MKVDPSIEKRRREAALLFVYAGASPSKVRRYRRRSERAVRRRERAEALARSTERAKAASRRPAPPSAPPARVFRPPAPRKPPSGAARGLPGPSDEAVERGFWLVLSLLAFWLMVGAIFAVGAFP